MNRVPEYKVRGALDDARKLLGKPPHHKYGNLHVKSADFSRTCEERHGSRVFIEAIRRVRSEPDERLRV